MAELLGGQYDYVDFARRDGRYEFSGTANYHSSEPYPWKDSRLLLLSNAIKSVANEFESYCLAVVQSSNVSWYEMHRVGVVYAKRQSFTDGKMSIHGILR
jgi:hypothetical protein